MTLDDAKQSLDDVTIFIKDNLPKLAPFVPECSIYRVPKELLDMNRNAYVPRNISIGPFHREQNFKATEELKLRFFNSYQCRVGMSVEDIVENARGWEEIARRYYSETINMDSKEFVKMIVLDGCFIVEFMIMNWTELSLDKEELFPENENKVHSSFYKAIEFNMSAELIMLENQLPFCVLQNLFDLIPSINNIKFFRFVVHSFLNAKVMSCSTKNRIEVCDNISNQSPRHLLEFLSSYFIPKNEIDVEEYCAPPSATQLSEAGIVFKKAEGNKICIMDISFKDGVLNIPPFTIGDQYEICARNLMVFATFGDEKNVENMKAWYAAHYFLFLDELITIEKDVNILVNEGIITNVRGGCGQEISQLFNDLSKSINSIGINCFSNIAKDLKQHCKRRRNRWMASLRHNYFNTPWALISFLAATFLILLTLLQTLFSGISTYK